MLEPLIGKKILIHCYKHDGSIHRSWSKGFVLDETKDHIISINNRTLVTEADGRMWYTREPAICYFPKDKWFNVICMIRKTGVYYYCNIASPTLYDGEALKYIDYDLDLKVFPDGNYRILDEEEYVQHALTMGYSKELDAILKKQLSILIELAKKKEGPFNPTFTRHWYHIYQDLKKE
jgi:protein associated with RNAse G/E